MELENYTEISILFRKAREEKGLSREDVSHLLHIRLRYVEALEEGRISELPGIIYVRGYLQSYAAFLGLDKDEVLRRFEQLENDLPRRGFYFPQVLSRSKTPDTRVIWGGLALALLAYGFWLAALQPPLAAISVVEPFLQEKGEKARMSASILADVACLRPQEALYPPCIAVSMPEFSLMPHGLKAPKRHIKKTPQPERDDADE